MRCQLAQRESVSGEGALDHYILHHRDRRGPRPWQRRGRSGTGGDGLWRFARLVGDRESDRPPRLADNAALRPPAGADQGGDANFGADERTTVSRRPPGRATRQILSGSQLVPPPDPVVGHTTGDQAASFAFRYMVGLAALVVLAALVGVIWGPGPASAILLVLALGLIASWLVV
jgi:hypothetical protein